MLVKLLKVSGFSTSAAGDTFTAVAAQLRGAGVRCSQPNQPASAAAAGSSTSSWHQPRSILAPLLRQLRNQDSVQQPKNAGSSTWRKAVGPARLRSAARA